MIDLSLLPIILIFGLLGYIFYFFYRIEHPKEIRKKSNVCIAKIIELEQPENENIESIKLEIEG